MGGVLHTRFGNGTIDIHDESHQHTPLDFGLLCLLGVLDVVAKEFRQGGHATRVGGWVYGIRDVGVLTIDGLRVLLGDDGGRHDSRGVESHGHNALGHFYRRPLSADSHIASKFLRGNLVGLACAEGSQTHTHTHYGYGLAQLAPQLELTLQVFHLGLTFRTGTGTVALMVTFGGGIVDIVGLGHLHAHLLKGLADFLSSFHNGRFYPIYIMVPRQ